MDKDRIAGTAKEAKGTIKETAGKVLGDLFPQPARCYHNPSRMMSRYDRRRTRLRIS
jgi:hypothetical protein